MARLEDLDPATRRQVEQAIGRRSSKRGGDRQRPRLSTAGANAGTGSWRCTCGETFTTWAAAEAHPSGPGHGRVEVVFPESRHTPPVASDDTPDHPEEHA